MDYSAWMFWLTLTKLLVAIALGCFAIVLCKFAWDFRCEWKWQEKRMDPTESKRGPKMGKKTLNPQKWWDGKNTEEINATARKLAREAADRNHKPTYLRGGWDGVCYHSILCRICDRVSYNQNDVDALYCDHCKAFHVPAGNGPYSADAAEAVLKALVNHPAAATQGSSKMHTARVITFVYFVVAWTTFGLMYHSDTCKPDPAPNSADMRIPCSMAFGVLWPILLPLKAAIWMFDPETKLPHIKMQFSNEPAR